MKKTIYILLFSTLLNANEDYSKLFDYLMHKGVVLEEDISLEELYNLNQNGKVYLSNGELNLKFLDNKFDPIVNKKINKISSLVMEEELRSSNMDNGPKSQAEYSKLFSYLDENGLMLEKDIKLDELYAMKSNGKLFLSNGELNISELNKKLNIVLKYRKEESAKLHERLNKNNSKTNQEVKKYIEDNNNAISEAQKKIKENSQNSDSWFVKTMNSILDMLKQ